MAHIFVVEDNESIREAVTGYLQLADHEVSSFGDLGGAKDALEESRPDLILLDVMLPDGDGFIFAKELLSKHPIPLIFMSARESESDRITGFEIGADDYIVKPFSPKELVLRVAAVLKRTSAPVVRSASHCWILEGHELSTDEDSHKATLDGEPLKLTAAEWKILLYLSSNGGAVVTREQILDRCLEYSFEGYDRTVDTHIKNLRAKLGQPGWIETVRGYGYRFAGEST
ncbi:MAG: response regulator transcription factor [Spirochaetales bacterium]|nr:response regulator transcription factor [Spirochaetales bacterium]